jgi:hypothetical protein
VGYLQNKGWDKLPPDKAALAVLKSYRAAEQHLHTPPDLLVRMPKDANDTENWNKLNARLGVPSDAKEYDFSAVKFSDGSSLDDKFVETMRQAVKQSGVAKDRAPELVKSVVKFMEDAEALDSAEYETKLNAERETLKINWGSNITANKMIAEAAAAKLNVPVEAVNALEKQLGYAAVMEMFRNIGVRMGEDKFVSGGAGPGNPNGLMSREQAAATMSEKMNDSMWTQRLLGKDQAAVMEFNNLTRLMAGG